MAAALSRGHSLSVMTVYGPTGSPADARSTFMTCLSIIAADAEHARPDVAHVGELEQALDRAVLAERPVQQREDDVDLAEGARRLAGLVHDEGSVGGAGRHEDARGVGVDLGHVARRRGAAACGSSAASTQWPSLAMPTGTTS